MSLGEGGAASPLREAVGASPPGALAVEAAIETVLRAEEAVLLAISSARHQAEEMVLSARHEGRRILARADERAAGLARQRERRVKRQLQEMLREVGSPSANDKAQPETPLLERVAFLLAARLTGDGQEG
ncbi:MAG: hypothetical protein HQL51_03215 [Magnetococcales bacterium]|nr:hypothetical protein [Magnetococcales bacterium]